MIDDIYQDDGQEHQLKEKSLAIDLNSFIEHPMNCSYLNRFLHDKLQSFTQLQKQKIAQQRRKQAQKQNNAEAEKYKETHYDFPFEFQVDEELDDDDEEEAAAKDIDDETMADFNNIEKKKRRDQLKRRSLALTQQQSSIVQRSNSKKRTLIRAGGKKKTNLYENSLVENRSSSKISNGSFHKNTKTFKRFLSLEKICKNFYNSIENLCYKYFSDKQNSKPGETPTKGKKEAAEDQQNEHHVEEVDTSDFYKDPIQNQTLYQEIMQQGKPELMSIIKDEDGYGIFSMNKIIDLYDKVIQIQNQVNHSYLQFKDFQENQNRLKSVIKSKIYKRITEPPFNITEKPKGTNSIPDAFNDHKLSNLSQELFQQINTHTKMSILIIDQRNLFPQIKKKYFSILSIIKELFDL